MKAHAPRRPLLAVLSTLVLTAAALAATTATAAADGPGVGTQWVVSVGDSFSVRSGTSALPGGSFTSSTDAAETDRPLTAAMAHHALPATATTLIAAAAPSQIDARREESERVRPRAS